VTSSERASAGTRIRSLLFDNEEARPIPGYAGAYYATTEGRILSCAQNHNVRELRLDLNRSNGTARVTLCRHNKTSRFLVSTLVALTFIGRKPPDTLVLHLNGNNADNRPANLTYGTRRQLYEINVAIPLVVHGVRNNKAKLTPAKVRRIRIARSSGATYAELGRRYGVSLQAARAATIRQTWARVA